MRSTDDRPGDSARQSFAGRLRSFEEVDAAIQTQGDEAASASTAGSPRSRPRARHPSTTGRC